VKQRAWYGSLYAQVLLGTSVGHFFPKTGVALKPPGDGFISLIQMMIGPIIFGSWCRALLP
jgi:aerobic C4-dicarboxylate transport protein